MQRRLLFHFCVRSMPEWHGNGFLIIQFWKKQQGLIMIKELLDVSCLYLEDRGHTQYYLPRCQHEGEKVSFSSAKYDVAVTFVLKEKPDYLTVRIDHWKGVTDVPWCSLHWQLLNQEFQVTELDYMTQLRKDDGYPH
ncbi:MAG: hypothetical protein D6820_08445, partial [Lentisphaerae bacterium]